MAYHEIQQPRPDERNPLDRSFRHDRGCRYGKG